MGHGDDVRRALINELGVLDNDKMTVDHRLREAGNVRKATRKMSV